MELHPVEILPDLWSFGDSCNVYVLKRGDEAIAVDFGSGRWLVHLQALGIKRLTHVFLTHHHADQCSGLQNHALGVFKIHAPGGEEQYLDPACQHNGSFDIRYKGCPDSYAVLRGGIESITYDMAGFSDFFWGDQRIRFVHTPGHGRHACSIVIDHAGKQVVFCGDAAYAGATIWQPYHLEWDHWTGTGVLAAWEGIQRLYGIAVDMLCPSHGPVIAQQPRMMLKQLARKLMLVYHTKGQISIGEPDAYIMPQTLSSGAHRLSEHLYHFGANGYLIIGGNGGGLVIDPFSEDMPALELLLSYLGNTRPTMATSTHYHADHCDGIPYLSSRYQCRAVLHPWIAEKLVESGAGFVPWLPQSPIIADELWPIRGEWTWNEYKFTVAPWPGQTQWHCVFMTAVDGKRIVFGGDSFQPSSRWNGTGGYCAYNGSRFEEGFSASAALMMAWAPDIVLCGHNTYYAFRNSKFRKIIQWARRAEKAVIAICPSSNLDIDYYRIKHSEGALFWVQQAY